MAMPIDLVLVRHGQSEGNIANKYSKKGDDRYYTQEFCDRHSSKWRLSNKGIEQAKIAGDWIQKNVSKEFERYYTSEYIRAMETSTLLDLENAVWFADFFLRERDWGDFDMLPHKERVNKYADAIRRREIDSFYWTPPNGESMADLCIRLKWILDTLHRECSDKNVIMVCHGEVMWGFRVLLERIPQEAFIELDSSDDEKNRIHNCQVIQYSRKNPKTGEISPYLNWFRSVCPWDTKLSDNKWREIKRPRYSNENLISRVRKSKRIIDL